jgi:hypothetical protein
MAFEMVKAMPADGLEWGEGSASAPLGLKPESPAEVRAARLWLGATPGNKPGRVAERAPRTPGGGARLGQGGAERPAAQLA